MIPTAPSVLLVDDEQPKLDSFANALQHRLGGAALVRRWQPTGDDIPLDRAFNDRVDSSTALVVTDYDLTTSVGGFFGPSIVGWCQSRAIPVADFSRAHKASLPQAPNLFELRVPADDDNGSARAACLFRGFESIRASIHGANNHDTPDRPLSATLAAVLEEPAFEAELAPYIQDLGASNSALFESFTKHSEDAPPLDELKPRLLTYIAGHVLWNAVLRYPGVLLAAHALCAYVGTAVEEADRLADLFDKARYYGPFGDAGRWFWRHHVDSLIAEMSDSLKDDQFSSFDQYNRAATEAALGRSLANHHCPRCPGDRGGFWCPFTSRPVCDRSDCSAPESSWIPAGAYLARVDKGFHDEWAPILGI